MTNIKIKGNNTFIYAAIGGFTGYLALHPIAMIIINNAALDDYSNFIDIILKAFMPHHFLMGLYFFLLGSIFGGINGYYYTRILRQKLLIQEQKETLLNNKKSLEALVQNLKRSNDELANFTSIAAHDLRSPMAKINAMAGILKDGLRDKLDEQQHGFLDILIRSVNRTAQMVSSLYKYSQVDSSQIHLQEIDLNKIVQEIKDLLLASEIERTNGNIIVPETLHNVQGDESQLAELFQNLLENGLKYHKDDIKPEVIIRSRETDDNMVLMEVEDNGIGIKDIDSNKIFGMFQRLHGVSKYEGIGIGLAFCKKVAEQHGGQIGVRSLYGKGSVFWVTLPKSRKD